MYERLGASTHLSLPLLRPFPHDAPPMSRTIPSSSPAHPSCLHLHRSTTIFTRLSSSIAHMRTSRALVSIRRIELQALQAAAAPSVTPVAGVAGWVPIGSGKALGEGEGVLRSRAAGEGCGPHEHPACGGGRRAGTSLCCMSACPRCRRRLRVSLP